MATVVEILGKATSGFKPASADSKDSDNLDYDLGHLMAYDNTVIDKKALGSNPGKYLNELARDNTQLLLNSVFGLPSEVSPDKVGRVTELPKPVFHLPREKPIPKPRKLTTWEQFAKTKGIQKKKRGRMVWDEAEQKWAPRHGYKKANEEGNSWAIPAEEGETTGVEDPWKRLSDAKKQRVEKNRKQQMKNLQAASGERVPGTIDLTTAVQASQGKKGSKKQPKHHVDVALQLAQHSTASMGKHDVARYNEPEMQRVRAKSSDAEYARNRKREKDTTMSVLNKVLGRLPAETESFSVDKAINVKQVAEEGVARREKKRKFLEKKNKKRGGKK